MYEEKLRNQTDGTLSAEAVVLFKPVFVGGVQG